MTELPHNYPPPRRRRALLPLAALALLAACTGGNQPPRTGGPQAVINSPAAGSLTAGTFFFSVQPLDPSQVASVAFEAGGTPLGSDSTAADGFRVFVSAADHPAGALSLRATVTGKDGRVRVLTQSVTNVPQPAGSGTVGAAGAVLGTREADGSLSVLTASPGTSPGVTIHFEARTKEQVRADTGVDYDALGITFLGAQSVTASAELDRTLAVSSGGFGPQVQPGQSVVNYMIGPDADGDGVGEIVVVNTASVAPNGDVVSDPVPMAQVGQSATTTLAGRASLTPLAAGLSGPPGTVIELPVSGFNASSPFGNVAVFTRAGATVEELGRIFTSETGAQTFFVQVPPLAPGSWSLTLHNLGSGYVSDPIGVSVLAPASVAGPPTAIIEATLARAEEMLAAFDTVLAGSPSANFGALGGDLVLDVRNHVAELASSASEADLAELRGIAARIKASDVDALLSGVTAQLLAGSGFRAAQAGKCNDILDRADKGMDMINKLNRDPLGKVPGKLKGGMFGGWWTRVKNATLDIDQALGGNACRPPAPPAPGPSGQGMTPSGMGAAVPAGGNVGGAALPPGYRPIPDYQHGLSPQALDLQLARGRFVVKVAARGSATPFSGASDAGGYFMVPMVPEGEPFVAVAIDTLTGENRVAEGAGPALGAGHYLFFDFSTGSSEVREARWDGGGDGVRWLDPANWEGDMLPLPNSRVILDGPSGLVVKLDNFSGEGSKVAVHSLSGTAGLELSQGTLEVATASTLDGPLVFTNGTLSLLADLTLTGDTTWRSGGLAGSGRLINRGTITITADAGVNAPILAGPLRNEGTISLQGTSTSGLVGRAGGAIANASGATFEVRGTPGITGTPVLSFDNQGTIRKSGAQTSSWTGAEVNHLGGTVEVAAGTLLLAEGSASTGATWQVAQDAVLALGSHTRVIRLSGAYRGSGLGVVQLAGGDRFEIAEAGASFDFPAGRVDWLRSKIAGPGTLTNEGVMHIVRDLTSPHLTGHLANEGTLVVRGSSGGGLLNSGGATITNRAGAEFLFHDDQGIASSSVPLTFTNAGSLVKVGGVGTSTIYGCYVSAGGTFTAGFQFEGHAACP